MKPTREMTASNVPGSTPSCSPSTTRVSTLPSPASRALRSAKARMLLEMSVASTWPSGPARRAAASVWPPAPAATSSTRAPGATAAMSSIVSVAAPSQASSVGAQRCQDSAAVCHCSVVVRL